MSERSARVPAAARIAGLSLAVACAGCLGPRVDVMKSGPGVTAEPKPSTCSVEFHRARVDRPYDEIAALHAYGGDTLKNGPENFQDALRQKACELGADAVIVTQIFRSRAAS